MVKHTQTIRRQKPKNCLSVFDHFVGLGLKGLNKIWEYKMSHMVEIIFFLFFVKKFKGTSMEFKNL